MEHTESVPAYNLTEADFQRHPIWQFELDSEHKVGANESHVSPAAATALSLGTYGSFLVAATFRLKNGHELPGAVQVDFLGDKVHFTPTAIFARGKLLDPLSSDAQRRLARIIKTSGAKPVVWRLNAYVAGESTLRRGRIWQFTLVKALILLVQLISLRFTPRHR